jgi:lipopolysaccharide transport system permease protein
MIDDENQGESLSPGPRIAAEPAGVPAQAASAGLAADDLGVTVIRPRRGWQSLGWDDLWRYRELLYFLTWRDIKVRYKQTVLGVAWAVIQPVVATVVFALFFGKLAGLSRLTDVPYPVFLYAGILPWTFFAEAVSQASQSLITSSSLLTKVYFPRLIVPAASVAGLLVDLAISLVVMGCLLAGYGVWPGPNVVLLPLLLVATVLTTLGVGTLLAALTVAYRDFRYVVPFLLQIWLFASPVVYGFDEVPSRWQLVYALNPMAGIIDGYRASLVGEPLRGDCLVVSVAVAVFLFFMGTAYFRRAERRFADIV